MVLSGKEEVLQCIKNKGQLKCYSASNSPSCRNSGRTQALISPCNRDQIMALWAISVDLLTPTLPGASVPRSSHPRQTAQPQIRALHMCLHSCLHMRSRIRMVSLIFSLSFVVQMMCIFQEFLLLQSDGGMPYAFKDCSVAPWKNNTV